MEPNMIPDLIWGFVSEEARKVCDPNFVVVPSKNPNAIQFTPQKFNRKGNFKITVALNRESKYTITLIRLVPKMAMGIAIEMINEVIDIQEDVEYFEISEKLIEMARKE